MKCDKLDESVIDQINESINQLKITKKIYNKNPLLIKKFKNKPAAKVIYPYNGSAGRGPTITNVRSSFSLFKKN